jgi:hypothetical protein
MRAGALRVTEVRYVLARRRLKRVVQEMLDHTKEMRDLRKRS